MGTDSMPNKSHPNKKPKPSFDFLMTLALHENMDSHKPNVLTVEHMWYTKPFDQILKTYSTQEPNPLTSTSRNLIDKCIEFKY